MTTPPPRLVLIPVSERREPRDFPYSRTAFEAAALEDVGCFYCLCSYPLADIKEWVGSDGESALCPHCGINSVVGTTDEEILQALCEKGFHFLTALSQEATKQDPRAITWRYRTFQNAFRGPLAQAYDLQQHDLVRVVYPDQTEAALL